MTERLSLSLGARRHEKVFTEEKTFGSNLGLLNGRQNFYHLPATSKIPGSVAVAGKRLNRKIYTK